MERKLVTIRKIKELRPIPGADKIELAIIDGWQVVVGKGQFKVGDLCKYYEIDSFLPLLPDYMMLLRGSKPKAMIVDGQEQLGIRLRSIRLKGQLSQGLALPLESAYFQYGEGFDLTDFMGVIKFEIPIPPPLSGIVKGDFPGFLRKTDEERIQNMLDVIESYVVTEKLDGTSTTYYKKDGVFGVCSRNLELAEGDTTQWRLAKEMGLIDKLPDNMAIQGEIIGEGIQKNPLKRKGQEFYAFNVYNIASGAFLPFKDFVAFCAIKAIPLVPIVSDNYALPDNPESLLLFAEGKSLLSPNSEREGIVIRHKGGLTYNGSRLSFKVISNKYLLETDG